MYEADVSMTATLPIPELQLPEGTEALWKEAVIVTGATDLRGTGSKARMELNGRALGERNAPEGSCTGAELLRWGAGVDGAPVPGTVLALSGGLAVRGTGSFGFRPLARRAELTAAARWASPGLTGAGLPNPCRSCRFRFPSTRSCHCKNGQSLRRLQRLDFEKRSFG